MKTLLIGLLAGLMAGMIMAFSTVKDKFHPSHRHKEHHHGHDD